MIVFIPLCKMITSSSYEKDITALEDVQKFALKISVHKTLGLGPGLSAVTLLTITNLPSLESRRHQAKLCHLFKIANAQTYFPDAPLTNRTHHYAVRSAREHSLNSIPISLASHTSPVLSMHGTLYPQALIPVLQLLLLSLLLIINSCYS